MTRKKPSKSLQAHCESSREQAGDGVRPLKQRLNEILAALICTFVVPICFGYGVARLFGIWIGIGAGILAAILCVASMMLLWHFARRWRNAAKAKDRISNETDRAA